MFKNMEMWSDVGLAGSSMCAFICFLLSVRIVIQPNGWIKGSVFMLAIGTLVYFLGLLMPPFTFLFKSGFKVHGGDNSTDNSSAINSDPQIQHTLNNAVGTGFSTVAFTWYAILFAFLVEGIPVGFFLASSLFRHQRAGEANSVLSIHRGRIQVIMWLAHLMAPMTQLLASIILYQVAGTSNEFAICWVFLWSATTLSSPPSADQDMLVRPRGHSTLLLTQKLTGGAKHPDSVLLDSAVHFSYC